MTYECKRCIDGTREDAGSVRRVRVICPYCNGTKLFVRRARAGLAAPGKHGEFYVYPSSQRVTLTARTPGHPQAQPTEEHWRALSDITKTKYMSGLLAKQLRGAYRLLTPLDDFLSPHDFPPTKAKPAPPLDLDAPCGCFVCMDIFKNGTRRPTDGGPSDMKLTEQKTGKTMYASQSLKAKIMKVVDKAKKGTT